VAQERGRHLSVEHTGDLTGSGRTGEEPQVFSPGVEELPQRTVFEERAERLQIDPLRIDRRHLLVHSELHQIQRGAVALLSVKLAIE